MTRNELRAEWIRRLRSGDYKQGRGTLHRRYPELLQEPAHDAFCCLGVVCHLLVEKGLLVGGFQIDPELEIPYGAQGDGTETYLPEAAIELLGMVNYEGAARESVDESEFSAGLAALNDSGVSFAEIADRLETGDYWEEA